MNGPGSQPENCLIEFSQLEWSGPKFDGLKRKLHKAQSTTDWGISIRKYSLLSKNSLQKIK